MKFVLKPSLQHMILVKIAVSLWNQNDVKYSIFNIHISPEFNHTSEKWKKIENCVIEKLPQLSLPHLLKEKVLSFIKPIGIQILEWVKFHSKHYNLRLNLQAEFCWTPEGTIDRKKTAEVLIKDENLDTPTRYQLSCIYCFEDDIKKFWKNMPEILKESFLKKSRIIIFWSRIMRGRGLDPISYGSEFHQAACWGNRIGAEYFLQKLTPSEREHYLVDTAKFVRDADVLLFLLSEMEEEQQTEVFKKIPCRVLSCFLQFPLQNYFFEIANCIWDFFSVESYNDALRNIIDKVTNGFKDWNYQSLFREFWQKTPDTLKSWIENDINKKWFWLIPALFKIKDKENIKLILKDAIPAAREKLINGEKLYNYCQNSILANEWDFLEFGIRECFPSKDEMLKFKEEFEKSHYLMSAYFKEHLARNKKKWDQLFTFSHDSLSKCNKRSIEESECSSSKRFQSLQ